MRIIFIYIKCYYCSVYNIVLYLLTYFNILIELLVLDERTSAGTTSQTVITEQSVATTTKGFLTNTPSGEFTRCTTAVDSIGTSTDVVEQVTTTLHYTTEHVEETSAVTTTHSVTESFTKGTTSEEVPTTTTPPVPSVTRKTTLSTSPTTIRFFSTTLPIYNQSTSSTNAPTTNITSPTTTTVNPGANITSSTTTTVTPGANITDPTTVTRLTIKTTTQHEEGIFVSYLSHCSHEK